MTKAFLAVMLLVSLFVPVSVLRPAAAAPEEAKWERVNIPANGETGNWVLAAGSDVKHPTLAKDGAIYAYANPTGASSTLFKSTDAGLSWSATGNVQEAITGIATASDDASLIYYATASGVYKSADAGKTFNPLPAGPGGAGTGNITITSLAVARLSGKSFIAIGTTDNDSSQFGGVYTLDESKLIPGWENTGPGNYDAAALAFAPSYAANRQLLAVVTDEQNTFVSTRIGIGGWDQAFGRATIAGRAARAAAIAFPDDYDVTVGEFTLFIGIDTGSNNGDVFKIKGRPAPDSSTATKLNVGASENIVNIDVTGLVASGNSSAVSLLAGAAASTRVYLSTDNGTSWARSRKEPTGQSRTYLIISPNFSTNRTAYAATSGTDSAFSYTNDGGGTWDGAGLIDARISSNAIIALAISPDYRQDETLFMLTFDGVSTRHSLWRSRSGGTRWERVFAGTMTNVDTLSLIGLSPRYGTGNQTVFLAGTANGVPALWKSTNNGQTFTYRTAPAAIDTWTVVDDDRLFLGSYNGSNGLIYSTEDGGFFFSKGVPAGSQSLKSIALSSDYEHDQTILVGNSNGWVYYSSDNGSSFKPLPPDATSAPLTSSIYVAFDADFASNKTVYAASNTANKGIYRFIINKSTKWERIDSTLPTGGTLSQIAISANGTLYSVNSQSVNGTASKGGIERSLNPTNSLGPTFETVTRGLDDGVNLSGLWLHGGQLWSIDTQNTRVMTFADSLARPVTLTTPADRAAGTGVNNVILKWETLKGATEYKWQLDYDTDFSAVPAGFEGTTQASSARLPALDTDTTYYWRVRATKPVLNPWSIESSFTTGLGSAAVAPERYSPKAGAEGVSLRPLFQWGSIAGASSYELLVASDIAFKNPVIARTGENALPATAWRSETNLDYGATYYWKVRGSSSGSRSAWSAVGAFITASPPANPSPAAEPAPVQSPPQPIARVTQPAAQPPQPTASPPSPPAPIAPPPPAQSALPGWFPYMMGGVFLAIVVLAVAILILVVKIKRS